MACQQIEGTDSFQCLDKIEGLDITVDGCPPEFKICKLRDSVDESVFDALHLSLEKLICPSSSIVVTVNPSRKVSWTLEDPETNDKVVAAVVSVNVQGYGDGKPFRSLPMLGSSIVEGVNKYIITMKDKLLEHVNDSETNITEIKVVTNIKLEDDDFLAFKVNPVSGSLKRYNVPWQEAAALTGWRRQIRYATPICRTCRSDIVIGQTKIFCGGCSSEFHWTCVEIDVGGRSKAMRRNQWLCNSCSSAENGDQPATGHQTGTAKRRRKRRKMH